MIGVYMIIGIVSFSTINGIIIYMFFVNLKKEAEMRKKALEERRIIRLRIMKTLRAKYYRDFDEAC
ncbi:hypothetical protein Fsol_00510 [Candidatus Fokinia solitaria]|uniref:Uncharacterized protein n=1 Tax=Candidatus Fokinia solitaria TaxID=1802984 RepID=A0A2U8BSG9_9RICK|nr:hypothetical protein [Candidatus Fokinia solitaria]AWD33304.1 hypothetical protein Fsol_00510 [Candidatus Fokinia solitaria]